MKPVSKTAFYCAAVRMWDAESPRPILGDMLAARLMSPEGRAIVEPFRRDRIPNQVNVVRHRLIDEIVGDQLRRDPSRLVVLIGAGLDTRAFRLTGGRWIEVDEAPIIDHKEGRLPAGSAPNPLERLAIDFATDSLVQRLDRVRTEDQVTVVVEGVLMYLDAAQVNTLLEALQRLFPRHLLICDVMSGRFMSRFGRGMRRRLAALGATLPPAPDDPRQRLLDAGYRLVEDISLPARARDLGAVVIPRFLLDTLLRGLRDGYRLLVLERGFPTIA